MGQYDQSEKLLEDYNDVFSDIINVNLYNGELIVAEDDLHPSNNQSHYKADDAKLHEQERDISKYWKKGGVIFALYAIENQTNPDKRMPLRIIAYDGANYRSQLLNDEVVRFYPCISIVLYFGMRRWNTPKNLKELLEIPKELEPFINDYQIHVIEVAWLTDEQVAMYQSDFRIVAEYFVQKRKNENYHPTALTIKHVDEVLKMLEVFGGANQLAELYNTIKMKEKEGDATMCEMLDRTINDEVNKRLPIRVAEEMSKLMAEEVPKVMAEKVSKAVAKELSNAVAKELPNAVAKELPNAVAKELPNAVAKELPNAVAKEVAKKEAAILINYVENLQKNLKCTLEAALSALGKTIAEYEQAAKFLNSLS